MSKVLTFEEFEALMRVAGYSLRVRRRHNWHGWEEGMKIPDPVEVMVDVLVSEMWLTTFDVPAELTEDWVADVLDKAAISRAGEDLFRKSQKPIVREFT